MCNRLTSLVPALVVISAVLACGASRVEKLTERADAFNRSLRWSSVSAAGALISEDQRRSLVGRLSRELGQNQIVDYSILDLGFDEGNLSASVLVEFNYTSVVHQDLRYRQELQSWKYDSKKRNWFVVDVKPVPTQ